MLFTTTLPTHLANLRDLDLFAACTTRDLSCIDSLATTVRVGAGRVLCRRGDIGRECFVLLDGHADVNVDGHHHNLHRGAPIGEMSLLAPGGRRNATATALSEMNLLVLTRTEFASVMSRLPTVAHAILRETSRRVIENAQRVDQADDRELRGAPRTSTACPAVDLSFAGRAREWTPG